MSQPIACARCGDFVAPDRLRFSDAGEAMCGRCADGIDLDQGEQRAAGAIFGASGSALGLGLVAIFFNPCLVLTIMGVLSAGGTFALLYRHPEYRARLGWRFPATLAVASAGLLVSLLAPVMRIVVDVVLDALGV